ncbi:unnamed protein product [Leptosia nina]|uniref:C2H2-type domain-containing protein n=1 Tax=Leptosia nina TaxID=320188 RepID=A0AAV1K1Z1_9NEOP
MRAFQHAKELLQYSTVYPFRLKGSSLSCVYCQEEFKLPSEFRLHVDDAHKKFTVSTAFAHCGKALYKYLKVDCTNLKCRLCNTECNDIEEVSKHLRDLHGSKIDVDCNMRLQPYKLSDEEYVCALCSEKLPSLTKLCRHTSSHYLKYTCDTCGRGYMAIESLRYHIRCSHSGKLKCRKCWLEFPTEELRKQHCQETKACWFYCCVTCGERFRSWDHKHKHIVEVHGKPGLSYRCVECDIFFKSRKRFYAHHKLKHSDDIFMCPCCNMKFDSKKRLEEHAISHTGEKRYKCIECNKGFSRVRGLKQHMWIHTESKRFSCMICLKKFSQKVSWQGHMRSHHPELALKVNE